jgi:hypothetical protein
MLLDTDFSRFEVSTIEELTLKKWHKEFNKRKDILSPIFDQKIPHYIKDFSTLKSYKLNGIMNYILTTNKMPVLRSGFEKKLHENCGNYNFVNDDKLLNNVARTKSKILEYSLCNEWEYFFTGTIDSTKFNRFNLDKFYKSLSKFFNNYNRDKKTKLEYLLIPEQHKNFAWHFHGFMKGIEKKDLISFTKLDYVPINLKLNHYLNFPKYSKKFGYCSLGKIKKREACAKYMTKYISKSMLETEIKLNSNSYYHSTNLKKYSIIGKGILNKNLDIKYTFENDFIKKMTFTSSEILENIFNSVSIIAWKG